MFVLFFKQKTAYEMRISDWSSDVCSSDLGRHPEGERDLPRRHGLPFREFHILRRKGHGLPLKPAFKQHGPPGIAGALITRLKIGLQPLELAFRQDRKRVV